MENSSENKEESIMTLYMNSLNMSIENELSTTLNPKEITYSILQDDERNIILIKLKLKKKTNLNPLSFNIYFYIKINEFFPESAPYVTCKSNFTYPTVFDNRNLTRSILAHKWLSNTKLTELIKFLPRFINKYSSDIKNRIFCDLGEFYIEHTYDVNDFLSNLELIFFKVEVEICSSQSNSEITLMKEQKYLILTDVHILIFNPDDFNKNTAKLIFVENLKHIISIKETKVFNSQDIQEENAVKSTGLIIEWISDLDIYKFNHIIIIDSDKSNHFIESINSRIKKLKDKFLFFQYDYSKINLNTLKNENEIKNMTNLIEYREKLYNESGGKDENNLRDLMVLYQSVIEVFSAQNDEKCMSYMNKLQQLFKNSKGKDGKGDNDFFLLV